MTKNNKFAIELLIILIGILGVFSLLGYLVIGLDEKELNIVNNERIFKIEYK